MIHTLKIEETTAVVLPRTCARCGNRFRTAGRRYVCPDCRRTVSKEDRRAKRETEPLSRREKQIIELVTEGLANKEVAYRLRLAEGTIKEYLNRIYHKVGAGNRTELATRALQAQVQDLTAKLAVYEAKEAGSIA
jgi:DNA-binding NarL/FixJ family response regulator